MVVEYHMTPECVRGIAEFTADVITGWREGAARGVPFVRDAAFMTRQGIRALRAGLMSLGNECFRLAVPKLLEDLGPKGPAATASHFHALGGPAPVAGAGSDATAIQLTPGWDALSKSLGWNCMALCRWFLESAHDGTSLGMAVEEYVRWLEGDPESARLPQNLDELALNFVAAGQDERCLSLLRKLPKFEPPSRPALVENARAMAWAIATHRLERSWPTEEFEQAFDTFFRHAVPKMIIGGEAVLSTWLKVRYWDLCAAKPLPIDAFMRQYDFLPGASAPPVRM